MNVRVLIVDDQAAFRLAARMVVELTDGFQLVGEAETGEESVTLARTLEPDLVLMDVNLPGINGLEATRRIAAMSGDIRVIVLSTYEPEQYASQAMAAGAIAYVTKSEFGPDKLADAWESAKAS